MTGGGPTNTNERNALRETGWQPYSFVFEDDEGKKTYVPYTRFEPISVTLGFAADMVEAQEYSDQAELFDKALASIAQNITNKTYLTGLADAASVIAQPRQFLPHYTANLASSLVPNIVGRAAWAVDPVFRDSRPQQTGLLGIPEKIRKSVQRRIPFASRQLPPRRGPTGRVIETQAGPLSRFASPFQMTETRAGREVEELMADIGYAPGPPGRRITIKGLKLTLNDAEYQALADSHLMATELVRDRLLNSPSFQGLPDTEVEGGKRSKEYVIRQLYNRIRAEARKELLRESDFSDRITEAIRQRQASAARR